MRQLKLFRVRSFQIIHLPSQARGGAMNAIIEAPIEIVQQGVNGEFGGAPAKSIKNDAPNIRHAVVLTVLEINYFGRSRDKYSAAIAGHG